VPPTPGMAPTAGPDHRAASARSQVAKVSSTRPRYRVPLTLPGDAPLSSLDPELIISPRRTVRSRAGNHMDSVRPILAPDYTVRRRSHWSSRHRDHQARPTATSTDHLMRRARSRPFQQHRQQGLISGAPNASTIAARSAAQEQAERPDQAADHIGLCPRPMRARPCLLVHG